MATSALDRELLDLLEDLAAGAPAQVGRHPRPVLLARDLMRTDYWLRELDSEPALTATELRNMRKIIRDFLGPVRGPKPRAAVASTTRPTTRRSVCTHSPFELSTTLYAQGSPQILPLRLMEGPRRVRWRR